MKLQIAFDTFDTAGALARLCEIGNGVDIAEIGTPFLLREGMAPVRAIKAAYPGITVLADTKIADGGAMETADACAAGAGIVTVLAVADAATIQAAITTAHQWGAKVMMDLLFVKDIAARAKELAVLGGDYLCVHTGVDMQQNGRGPLADLEALATVVPPEKIAVAGGVTLQNIGRLLPYRPEIVVVGGYLSTAAHPREAVRKLKEAMNG